MEYLETFDAQNTSLGKTLPRAEVHQRGFWHRTAQIYVWNPVLGYLCHQRSSDKDLFPLLWDISIGGHLNPGETYLNCAIRELGEELGIVVTQDKLKYIGVISIDGQDEAAGLLDREHAGIFLYNTNSLAEDFKYQKEEIIQMEYLSSAQLQEELQSPSPSRAYVPLQEQYLEILHLIEANRQNYRCESSSWRRLK